MPRQLLPATMVNIRLGPQLQPLQTQTQTRLLIQLQLIIQQIPQPRTVVRILLQTPPAIPALLIPLQTHLIRHRCRRILVP
jgi:hypothetical protein